MKPVSFVIYGLFLLLTVSCNSSSSQKTPLDLKLELRENEVHSVDEIRGSISLTNRSASAWLVHSRLHISARQGPPAFSELLVLVYDSAGNLIDRSNIKAQFELPSEKTINLLNPGKKSTTFFNLSTWFFPDELHAGETYTIEFIYQNEIDVTKTFDGIEVPSWVGTIRSNKETFIILPE
jgi:hypothetical protein